MKPGEPAAIEEGERLTSVGVRLPIVNVAVLDNVPPGLSTCTLACPAVVSRLAGTVTVSVVPVTAVGASVVPRNTSLRSRQVVRARDRQRKGRGAHGGGTARKRGDDGRQYGERHNVRARTARIEDLHIVGRR